MDKQLSFKEKLLKYTKETKKKTNKHVWIGLIVLTVLMYSLMWLRTPGEAVVTAKNDDTLVTATMVGDMMFGRHVEEVTKRYGHDHLFRYVMPFFEDADYATGNFEHPVTFNDDYEEMEKNIHLQTKASSVEALKKLDFTVVNLANNHLMDYMDKGVMDTVEAFNKNELPFVGGGLDLAEASQIDYQEVNGVTIATLGFTDAYVKDSDALESSPGVLLADPEIFIPLIQEANEKADLVMVHVHWGGEYETNPSPRQEGLAKAIADSGADVILGHHPHVLQPVEVYNDTVIFYSLGNFIFDQGWSTTRETAIVQYKLSESGVGQFEISPLLIEAATPTPLGKMDGYYRKKIFNRLTKGSTIDFDKEDQMLKFTVDHSHITN